MNHISPNRTHVREGRWRFAAVMTLGLGLFLTGCQELLQVDLPGTVTTEALDNPQLAEVLVNSAIGQVECTLSRFNASNSAGNEDVFIVLDQLQGAGALKYQVFVDGGNTCDSGGDDGFSWWDPGQKARFLSEDIYERLTDDPSKNRYWETADIDRGLINFDSREQMLGVSALYSSIAYTLFGEHLCEITFSSAGAVAGKLKTPTETLAVGEGWLTTALGHIQTHISDFVAAGGTDAEARALPYSITTDVVDMIYALRARTRWAMGDATGAVSDATQVAQGFVAWVTRNAGLEDERENHAWLMYGETAANLYANVAGPVDWWTDPLGTAPGAPWPLFVDSLGIAGPQALIPFTGYRELAIEDATGRAVDVAGNAITIGAGSTLDSRVDVQFGAELTDGNTGWVQQKYATAGEAIALVKWQEMAFIRAMADPANAVARINEVRTAAGLTNVTYAPAGDEITNMILEEVRREHFLEGRFWSWKIRDQLTADPRTWFPRSAEGSQFGGIQINVNGDDLQGAVRMLMQNFEFNANVNLSLSDRSTRCDARQRPAFQVGG